jgi:hypothetical protein
MEIGAALPQTVSVPDVVRRPPAVDTAASNPPPEPPHGVSSEVLDAIAAQTAANTRSSSRIRVDDATDRVVVQFLNAENEVIKQYPPEDLLRVLRNIREIRGLLFDRQA